ncbi:reticulocyte-binding protein 2 homolog a-like [Scyliorhinus canicula]|uniref:reticulocyte-binding protein 2 homolog a-like n=1 Tax=Scyliorhinus canicula TaxID=7830 RepID=UPI0018F70074|nr:reticulocyte-binding protein 2 homolog a-like [Scyliorhinus canicula]XP_038635855.1 reticulocyte-binding protein 2 homolog a-like [Scyliorhinus canicula]XP_038635856.1 reticulocyte-binding protein 2 homolog a-like [Scyliorhinus canicula]XP_038635857.1 reticulocyte-binding protein 2 homolog a-like [Scyliorhinus canicula]XP_038635858.1 reticulocyte-binding protein 2 homolog a-like [Scyliorhinus canicula]
MARIKDGNKSRVKVEENTKGKRRQNLFINAEGIWPADVLKEPRQLPKRTSPKKPHRSEKNNLTSFNPEGLSRAIGITEDNFDESQCGKNEDFEEAENECPQDPPFPIKVSIVKKERKHMTSKSETLQRNEKILEKPRIIIAVLRPFGLRILYPNSAPTTNVSIQHIKKWKMKMRAQTKQQNENIPRKKVSIPTDSHLENSNNNVVKEWVHQKNELLKKEREAKRKLRRLEKAKRKRQEMDHQKRQRESEEKVKRWMEKKLKNSIQKNMKINDCMIPHSADGNAQNAKPPHPVVNAIRKSASQSPANTLKTEKQITENKLEMNKKRMLNLGIEKSKTVILKPYFALTKDQVMNSCKVEATLVQDSQHDQESQKSNSKKVQKINLVHERNKEKSISEPTPFKTTKRDSPSSGNTSHTKELDIGNCRSGAHLTHRLPFHEWLSKKSKESKAIQAKLKEQEPELDKDFQTVITELAFKRMQNKMDSKRRVNTGKEFDKLANIALMTKLSGVNQDSILLQEARVTPAVKNWFVQRLEENLNSENSNSATQDGRKVHHKSSYSLSGKSNRAVNALKQGRTFNNKEIGGSLEEILSDLNAKLCRRPDIWSSEEPKQ